jgi:LysM repeat protein
VQSHWQFQPTTQYSGDSLWKISNQFGVSIDQIKKLNGLQSDSLRDGQKLILSSIANQKPGTSTGTCAGSKCTRCVRHRCLCCQERRSLWAIARQFGTSIANIKEINGLTTDALKIGQTLKINASAAVVAVPVSRSGDSAVRPDFGRCSPVSGNPIQNTAVQAGWI